MFDFDQPQVPHSTALCASDLAAWVDRLADIDVIADEAELIDRIAELERVKAACAAAQATVTVAFAAARTAGMTATQAKDDGARRSIAAQIALARRDSPIRGGRHLGLAKILTQEMPNTFAALRAGQVSEWRATLIARETACLSVDDRRKVDEELADQLPGMGDRQTAQATARIAQRLDPASCVARNRKAVNERRVSVRPAPDTMTYVSALLPVAHGVAVFAALSRYAASAAATGDGRTRGQLMADEFVTRITTPTAATAPGEAGTSTCSPSTPAPASPAPVPDTASAPATDSPPVRDAASGSAPVPDAATPPEPDPAPESGTVTEAEPDSAEAHVWERTAHEMPVTESGTESVAKEVHRNLDCETASLPITPSNRALDSARVLDSARDILDPATRAAPPGVLDARNADSGAWNNFCDNNNENHNNENHNNENHDDQDGTGKVQPGLGVIPPGVNLDIQLIMTDRTLFDQDPEPAILIGHGSVPAPLARQLVRGAGPHITTWIRRLFADPGTGHLITGDARRRTFSHSARQFLVARDHQCRTPWCDAPIRHADHVIPHAQGGPTTIANGQGYCENCNYTKQTPGWSTAPAPDGVGVITTTPTGHTHRSDPPPPPRSPAWQDLEQGLPAIWLHGGRGDHFRLRTYDSTWDREPTSTPDNDTKHEHQTSDGSQPKKHGSEPVPHSIIEARIRRLLQVS